MSSETRAVPGSARLFYDGSWHPAAAGATMRTSNPATGADLGAVAVAGTDDVDAAVRAARRAFPAWRGRTPTERAGVLKAMAAVLRANADELARIDVADSGGPVTVMLRDVETSAQTLEFFAGLVSELKGETVPMGDGNLNYTVREPWGVVACILAYNHPLLFAIGRIAPALAAGNTVVVKPADQTPLSALRLAELFADVLPAGVFNVVTGDRGTGAALAAHPLVARSSLVGSVATGKAVLRAAAEFVRPVALELGGKNAMIVRPDAPADVVVAAAVGGMNLALAGQSCGSITRLFLHDSVHDALLPQIVEAVAKVRPGSPESPDTRMGPLISEAQRQKVVGYVESAKAEGARLMLGGGVPADPALAGGFFFEPTIFADVTMDMRVAREEIFGPVLSVLRWSDEETVIEQANMLDYGLTAAIFTRDLDAAHRFARRLEAGYVWVNQIGNHFLGAPFGGAKQSGLGREECLEELLASTQVKNVNIRFLEP
mgnify:CR=1 FL=1